jgi:hypothetical protein
MTDWLILPICGGLWLVALFFLSLTPKPTRLTPREYVEDLKRSLRG